MPEFLVSLWLRVKALILRRGFSRDLDDELRFHLAMRQERLQQQGLAPADATATAKRRFGNVTQSRETLQSLWRFAWLDSLGRDLRYAFRTMAKAPVFTAVAVLTLAFGIGANTAIFSIVNSVLLHAMPYHAPEQIYSIREAVQVGSERHVGNSVNGGNAREWARRAQSFEAIAQMEPSNDDLVMGADSVRIHGLRVSASLFDLLGIHPRIGRGFRPEEDEIGRGLQMILTDALWRERFNANPDIVGKTAILNGYRVTVIGVLPPSFYFPKQEQVYGSAIAGWTYHVEYFLNLNLTPWERKPGMGNRNFAAIGRIRPGVTRDQALAELDTVQAGIGQPNSAGATLHAELVPLKAAVAGPAEGTVWLLMAGAALVLAVVCVNLAGLMLGRNTARSREVAVRLALGAGRSTVLRQFAVEGLVLAAAGGAIGVLAAIAGVRLLVRYAPITLPRLESVTIDGRVLLFSTGVSLAVGLLCSLLPALRSQHKNIEGALRAGSLNASSSRRATFVHNLLAGSEMALCTVLLICALLLGQSLSRVLRANAWLKQDHVIAVEIGASPFQYQSAESRVNLYRKLAQDTRALPGIESAGLVSALPLQGEMWTADVSLAEIPTPEASRPFANFRFVTPGYDEAIGLGLAGGRPLRDSDEGHAVVLISESIARMYPDRNPVGMHLEWGQPSDGKQLSLEIIGVIRDFRANAESAVTPAVYIPYWFWPPWNPTIVIRTTSDPAGVASAVRSMIRKSYAGVPVSRVEMLPEILDEAVASRRFLTQLGIVFAGFATFLAALGLYGVVSLAAARRRREIAIRIAVGASRNDVFRMVTWKALLLTAVGVAVGLLCGMGIERIMTGLLYDVHAAEPAVYAVACLIVMAVGLLASLMPALRAAKVDPVSALKYD